MRRLLPILLLALPLWAQVGTERHIPAKETDNTFTGKNVFVQPVTVADPVADTDAANKQYVAAHGGGSLPVIVVSADPTGTVDSSTAFALAASASALNMSAYGTCTTILVPNGRYLIHEVDLSAYGSCAYLKAEHNGEAKLYYNGAGGSDSYMIKFSALSFGGLSGFRFIGTDPGLTTIADHHLVISGVGGTPVDQMGVIKDNTFAVSCGDSIANWGHGYTNWRMDGLRFDSIGGFGAAIPGWNGMENRPFVMQWVTMDNNIASSNGTLAAAKCPNGYDGVHWGKGLLSLGLLNSWTANKSYQLGQQIKDSNGNVQEITALSGDAKSGSGAPTWNVTSGQTTSDNHATWTNRSTPNGATGMDITVRDARVEFNAPLIVQGNGDESLVYEDNTTTGYAAGKVTLENVWGYFNDAQHGTILSTNSGRLDLEVKGSTFGKAIAMVKNRATGAFSGRIYGTQATSYRNGANAQQERGFNLEGRRIEVNATNLLANYSRFQAGDIVLHQPGEYTPGSSGIGRVAVSPATGYGQPAGSNASTTAVVTSGSTTVTVDPRDKYLLPNDNIILVGAGPAGADLATIISAVDFLANSITVADAPSTSVNPATITFVQPLFREVGMGATRRDLTNSGCPTTGTWFTGEIVWAQGNTYSFGQPIMCICTDGGTPGTWVTGGGWNFGTEHRWYASGSSDAMRSVYADDGSGKRWLNLIPSGNNPYINFETTFNVAGSGAAFQSRLNYSFNATGSYYLNGSNSTLYLSPPAGQTYQNWKQYAAVKGSVILSPVGTAEGAASVSGSVSLLNSGIATSWASFLALSPVRNSGTATIGTAYGLYIEKMKAGSFVGASYGVYQADAGDPNTFKGLINADGGISVGATPAIDNTGKALVLIAPGASTLGGVKSGQCTTTTGKLMGYDTSGNRICETDQTAAGGMTWPAGAGIMVYGGSSAYGTSLTAPSGTIVGSSDTIALTNKDLTGAGNTFPTLNQNTSGTAATITGALALANTPMVTRGDILIATTATPVLGKLAKGTQYQTLQGGASDPGYDAVHLDQATAITGALPWASQAHTASNVVALWTTCSGYLKSDGTCDTGAGGGIADPGANGIITRTALNTTAPAVAADVVSLFGSGTCSGALMSDGSCVSGGANYQTANYTALAGDIGKIIVMNCSSCTLTLPASPAAGWNVAVQNIHSTALTVSRNSLTLNGGTTDITLPQYRAIWVGESSGNYLATVPYVAGTGLVATASATAVTWTPDFGTTTGKVAQGDDSRLTNARTPTAHAATHVTGSTDVIASAVAAGNAGLMTGADKSKLDGITAGATAVTLTDSTSTTSSTVAASATAVKAAYDLANGKVGAGTATWPSSGTVPVLTGTAHGLKISQGVSSAETTVAVCGTGVPIVGVTAGDPICHASGALGTAAFSPATSFQAALTNPVTGPGSGATAGHVAKCTNTSCTTIDDGVAIAANLVTYATPATGIARTASGSQAIAGSELSGDATTSGSNAVSLAAPFKKRSCEIAWGGTGAAFVLTTGDDAVAHNSCFNKEGTTRTIVGVYCRSDVSSNTTTVNPTYGAAGTGTTILAGALTCGSSDGYSTMATGCSGGACTISNAALADGSGINPAMAGTLTGTSIHVLIVYTVPAS